MKLPFRLLALPAVISVLALQLVGCGEGSNNLVDLLLSKLIRLRPVMVKKTCVSVASLLMSLSLDLITRVIKFRT